MRKTYIWNLLTFISTESCFREFYVAVGDDSGVPPKLLCGEIDQFFVLVQAHKVLVLSHAERDIHGGEGFKVFYSTLNQSVWEGGSLTYISIKIKFTYLMYSLLYFPNLCCCIM